MTHRWTRDDPTTRSLLDARGRAREEGARLGIANGGLTRVNLPEEGVTRAMISSKALHQVYFQQPVELPTARQLSNGGAGEFKCLWYADYSSGWIEQTWTYADVPEGVVQIEYSGWEWHNSYRTLESPKRSRYRLTVGGLTAAESPEVWTTWANPFLSAVVPWGGGNLAVTLGVRYSTATGDPSVSLDDPAEDQLLFAGGTLLVIGRHR